MKTNTTNSTTVTRKWKRFFGVPLCAGLMLALMVPVAAVSQSLAPVNLGTAGGFVILSKAGITTTGTTSIVGDIGISPAASTDMTGFGLAMDVLGSGTFSTSTLVTGKIYAANYTDPTPTNLTTAVLNMEAAYGDAAGRLNPNFTDLYTGDLTGQNLTPGLYKWSTAVSVGAAGVTITGTASDVWIFQIAQNLNLANTAAVTLSGGALVSNIFWQVAGQVTLGTTAVMKGIILGQTAIAMNTGATLNGRALAQSAVTLNANTVNKPPTVNVVENGLAPQEFSLSQNYPNPFNPSTRIEYSIERSAQVSLKVYNLLGLEVATLVNGRQEAGIYTVPFGINKGTLGLSSGVYFYRLVANAIPSGVAGSFVSTKKLILMK